MEPLKLENVVQSLGNMTVLEMIALTRHLEQVWDVKAEPQPSQFMAPPKQENKAEQTEFNVILASVSLEKKISVIKALRDILTLGLKEAKEFAEAAPKTIKEGVSKEEAELIKAKLEEAGALVEIK